MGSQEPTEPLLVVPLIFACHEFYLDVKVTEKCKIMRLFVAICFDSSLLEFPFGACRNVIEHSLKQKMSYKVLGEVFNIGA